MGVITLEGMPSKAHSYRIDLIQPVLDIIEVTGLFFLCFRYLHSISRKLYLKKSSMRLTDTKTTRVNDVPNE